MSATPAKLTLTGADLAALFSGGTGDGHDLAATRATLTGADLAAIFSGGPGDGFDEASGQFAVDGATLAALFGGGAGDGHDVTLAQVTLAGDDLAALFGGGTGDGHDVATFSGAAPVPLTLLALAAAAEGPLNVIRWSTADERGTDFFVVERATDATDFSELGEVTATGDARAAGLPNDYAFADEAPPMGTAYYRIHVYDQDGASELTEVVSVTRALLAADAPWTYRLYPNPNAGTELFVQPAGLAPDPALEITLTDVTGREVYRRSHDYDGVGAALRLGLDARLPAGTYAVRVRSGGETQAKLMIVR